MDASTGIDEAWARFAAGDRDAALAMARAACARDDAFATEPAPSSPLATRCDELGDLFGFEQPRLDA